MTYNSVPTTTVGEMLEPTWWDDNIVDNMAPLADDHDHGSANHGSKTLGASGGLEYMRLTDGSDPAAPGAGKTVIYSKAGNLFQRAGASGSPEQIEITGHTH